MAKYQVRVPDDEEERSRRLHAETMAIHRLTYGRWIRSLLNREYDRIEAQERARAQERQSRP